MLTSWAFEMEVLILGWYILVETGSIVALTAFGSLMFVGTLVAPMFGVFGDRICHRNLLAGMRAVYAVLATTMMTLALTGLITPVYVFILASILGLVRPSDLGLRGALVASTMPHAYLVSAVSLSRTTMDTARIAGALTGAGMFAALGMGPAYVLIACLYLVSTILTLCISPASEKTSTKAEAAIARASPWRDLSEGLAYIWNTPRMNPKAKRERAPAGRFAASISAITRSRTQTTSWAVETNARRVPSGENRGSTLTAPPSVRGMRSPVFTSRSTSSTASRS